MERFSFVNISKDPWSSPRKARKRLLFEALLKQPLVEEILYVDPHSHISRKPSRSSSEIRGVRVWQGKLILPGERFSFIRALNRWFIYRELRKQLKHGKSWHTFFYHPFDFVLAKHLLQYGPIFYDWTEDWGHFHENSILGKLQETAIKVSSGIVTVSRSLKYRAEQICKGRKRILFLPNATALKPVRHLPCPEEMKRISFPRICYIGHIGPWFDIALITELARVRPKWQFVMVGYIDGGVRNSLGNFSNIHLMGERPFEKIQAYMTQCQVLIAPYVATVLGDSTKLYDYLTSGIPIVSTDIETAKRLQPYVRIASGIRSWLKALEESLKEKNHAMSKARQNASLEHSWDMRARILLDWLCDLERTKNA